MAIEREKQPAESKLFSFEFAEALATAETLAIASPITQVNLGEVTGSTALTIGTASIDGTTVKVRIADGTHNENYKVTSLVTTSVADTILEIDGILHVRDD